MLLYDYVGRRSKLLAKSCSINVKQNWTEDQQPDDQDFKSQAEAAVENISMQGCYKSLSLELLVV